MIKRFINWVIKDKRTLGRVLIGLFSFSIWIFVSSSEEKLISTLNNNDEINWIFFSFLTGNSIAFNLSLGFIVSGIFYFFVSYLPEERRKKTFNSNS